MSRGADRGACQDRRPAGSNGDTVEVVRIVDGRGKGQSGGLFVRATARFAEAYRLAQDSRAWELLPSSRLFLPDGSTREGKTVTLTPPRDACID